MQCLIDSIREIQIYLRNACEVTDNFDIFEFTIRRYAAAIQVMFSTNIDSFSSLIDDESARSFWIDRFGDHGAVTYFEFIDAFYSVFESNSATEISDFIKFSINFPSDDFVTVYKFDVFVKQFGPFNFLLENITAVVTLGFAGLINNVTATEIYEEKYKDTKNGWLVRFSRKTPDKLTLNIATPDQGWVAVRLKHYSLYHDVLHLENTRIKLLNESMPPLPVTYHFERIRELKTMSNYASVSEAYVLFRD